MRIKIVHTLAIIIITVLICGYPPQITTGQTPTKRCFPELKHEQDSIISILQARQDKQVEQIKDLLNKDEPKSIATNDSKLLTTIRRLNAANAVLLRNLKAFESYMQTRLEEDKAAEDSMAVSSDFNCSTCPPKIITKHDTIEKVLRRKWYFFGKYITVNKN